MQQQEAVNFVENVLKLSSPLSKLRENKPLFFNEIIKAFLSVPFQNLHLLGEPEAGRHVPTWEGSKDSVMRGYGGICYSFCLFMKYLLEALGYDVYILLHVVHLVFQTTTLQQLFEVYHILAVITLLIIVPFQHLRQFLLTLRLSLQSTFTPTLSTSF